MGLGLNISMIYKILMIFVVVYFLTCIVFRYLIKANKVKPNKITKKFYLDDESFIKEWEKKRRKGKFKYVLYSDIIISIVIWSTASLVIVVTDGDFSKLENTLPAFFGALIGNTIGSSIRWNNNVNKYSELTKDIE